MFKKTLIKQCDLLHVCVFEVWAGVKKKLMLGWREGVEGAGREKGPMTGQKLIMILTMRGLEKTAHSGANRQTHGHGDHITDKSFDRCG